MVKVKTGFLLTFWLVMALLSEVCGQGPSAQGSYPSDKATEIIRNVFISVALNLPNGGLDPATVNTNTILLYPTANSSKVLPAFITFKNDLRNITLEPYSLLEMYTYYTFEITSGVKDVNKNAFQPYSFTFFTGETAFRKLITFNRNKEFGQSLASNATPSAAVPIPDITLTPEELKSLLEIELMELKDGADRFSLINLERFPEFDSKFNPDLSVPSQIEWVSPDLDMDALTLLVLPEDPEAPADPEPIAVIPDPVKPESKIVTPPYLKPIFFAENLDKDAYTLSLTYLPVPYEMNPVAFAVSFDEMDRIAARISEETKPIALAQENDPVQENDLDSGFEEGKTEKTEIKPGQKVKGVIRFPKSTIPPGGSLPIDFTFNEREEIRFVLRTYEGKVIKKESGYLDRGVHSRLVKLTEVEPGTYYAVVETTAQKVTKKIVILR